MTNGSLRKMKKYEIKSLKMWYNYIVLDNSL